MLGKVTFGIMASSFLYAAASGRMAEIGKAALDGAAESVTLTVSLLGTMCLWSGVLRLFSDAGVIRLLSRLLSPILRPVFPDAFSGGKGKEEICACLSSNILGIGNAATPFGLAAMKRLAEVSPYPPDTASDDMIALTVLASSSFCVFPTTVISWRAAGGCADPASVLLPVWIVSAAGAVLSLVLCRLCAACSRSSLREKKKPADARRGLAQ